jgi:predicted aconitase with swiveling domain
MQINGRAISRGIGEGEVLICKEPISFLGDIDPNSGICVAKNHAIEGKNITGKVLVFPHGKGSTVGSYVILALSKSGHAPNAMVNIEAEPIIAVGAIIAKIPMIDKLEKNPFEILKDGMRVKVDGDRGTLTILQK